MLSPGPTRFFFLSITTPTTSEHIAAGLNVHKTVPYSSRIEHWAQVVRYIELCSGNLQYIGTLWGDFAVGDDNMSSPGPFAIFFLIMMPTICRRHCGGLMVQDNNVWLDNRNFLNVLIFYWKFQTEPIYWFRGSILWKVEKRQLWVRPIEWLKLNFASCVVHHRRSLDVLILYFIYNEARSRERSDRGRCLPSGKKASS